MFIESFAGYGVAFLAVSLIYWRILSITFLSSFVFTIVAFALQLSAIQGMIKLGVLTGQ